MEIIDTERYEAKEDFEPHRLIQEDEVQVVLLAFEPGQGLPVHTTPVDVFFYVIEGEPTIKVGDEEKAISAGNIVLSPKDIPHTVKNESEEDTKVLVVKTPNPNK
ncbi:MAG: cupin domain-containing protein [Thermoplasmatota archaeon]